MKIFLFKELESINELIEKFNNIFEDSKRKYSNDKSRISRITKNI